MQGSTPFFLVLFAGFLGLAGVSGELHAQEGMASFKTKYFEVFTDVDEEFAKKIAEHLNGVWGHYSRMFKWKGKKRKQPNRAIVFAGFQDFQAYERDVLREAAGFDYRFFFKKPGDKKNVLAAYVLPETFMMRRLRTAAFCQYLGEYILEPPTWFAEGMKLYFDGARYDPKKGFLDQMPGPSVRMWREGIFGLDEGPWKNRYEAVPVKEFMRMKGEAWDARAEVHRAQAWGLCHCLLDRVGKEGRARFFLYAYSLKNFASLAANTKIAFRKAFGKVDFRAFEVDFLQHMRMLRFKGFDSLLEARKWMKEKKRDEALAAFTTAVQEEPDCARYRLERGMCHEKAGKYEEALADFKNAARLNPLDGDSNFFLGRSYFILRQWEKARTHVQRAADLEERLRSDAKVLLEKIAEYEKAEGK